LEDGPEAVLTNRAEELADLLATHDVGQRLIAADLDLVPALPLTLEMIAVEGAQGAHGLVDGGVLQLAPGAQRDEEIQDLALAEVLRGGRLTVPRELPQPVQVGLAAARLQVFEFDKANEVLIPRLRGDAGVCRFTVVFLFHRT
jgi:hypothetical protein